MGAKKPLQRLRGKYLRKAPADLDYLIRVINCLPPEDDLRIRFMQSESLRAQVEADVGLDGLKTSSLTFDVRLSLAAIENVRELPYELRSFVESGEWKGVALDTTLNPFERYSQVWNAYQLLHGIARVRREPAQRRSLYRFGQVYIDNDGIVRESKGLFSCVLDATRDEKRSMEAGRIRECPICTRVFWAGRDDAEQCGNPKCKSALSSQLKRNPKLRDMYNLARRRKRQIKKQHSKTKRAKTVRKH
jgi:hypothetical protein